MLKLLSSLTVSSVIFFSMPCHATDSTAVSRPSVTAAPIIKSILIMEKGDKGSTWADPAGFCTSKLCPAGYNPFISLTVYEVDSSHCQPGAWGANVSFGPYAPWPLCPSGYYVQYKAYKDCSGSGTYNNDTHVGWQLLCIPT
jgi:hypothetical protein